MNRIIHEPGCAKIVPFFWFAKSAVLEQFPSKRAHNLGPLHGFFSAPDKTTLSAFTSQVKNYPTQQVDLVAL